MQKIRLVTDSPSDIPNRMLARYNIGMCYVPITIDGVGYYERRDFNIRQFYGMLDAAKEIPVTSRIPPEDYVEIYRQSWEQGYTDVINVTLNSGGSGIYQSANSAIELFYDRFPQARNRIHFHVVDSASYSAIYGHAVVQAARMAEHGHSVAGILRYLNDYFDRIEIYLACYTLEYVKKSGRVTAAAAFVGEALGLRPIISLIDGETKTVEKVRGDKHLISHLMDIFRRQRDGSAEAPILVASGSVDAYGDELQALLQRETGREVFHYKFGAAIAINAGPRAVAFATFGQKRENPNRLRSGC